MQPEGPSASDCIVCGSARSKPLYEGILRCEACGYVFADLKLSKEEFFALYSRTYFFGDEYSDYVADRAIIQKNFRLRLRTLRRFLDPVRHRTLFEIGSAYGFFLDLARERFDSVRGIDVAEDGVRYACDTLGLDVIKADLLEADLGEAKFDVVVMWDTIEHLQNPHLYIQKMADHMESGALLAITTGDIDSLNARRQKDRWRLLHPPTHAHYFSTATLTRMLDKYGFDVAYHGHCGFYRSIDNAAYNIFVLRQKRPAIYKLIKKLGLGDVPFYLNLRDILYLIARKR